MESSKSDKKSKVCCASSNIFSAKFSSQLTEHYANLLDSDVFTDFVLKCAGEEIRVHKCILAARSPVFAAMFRNDMNEAQSNSVDIVDIDSEILRKVLKFIYSGQVDEFTDAVARDLLYAADKYQLDLLKEACIENIKSTSSVSNVLDVLVIGELHDQSLKDHAIDFICRYLAFSELKKMDKWKLLQKTEPSLVIEVMTSILEYLQDSTCSKISEQSGLEAAAGHKVTSWSLTTLCDYSTPLVGTQAVAVNPSLNPLIPPQTQSQVVQGAAVHVQGREPLTRSMLADSTAKEQKQMLGERLFPVINLLYPDNAGKITGMLLEFDNSELLLMLENQELIKSKAREAAVFLCEAHTKKNKTGNKKKL